MNVYKPPQWPGPYVNWSKSVFLAGSIEMGAAIDWQNQVEKDLADTDGVICNPRRTRLGFFLETRSKQSAI